MTFDWILEIEKMLEKIFLVDDMNLNKTVIALFVIVEYVYQHEAIRFAQIQKQSTSSIDNNMSFIDNIVDHVVSDVASDIVKSLKKNVANTKIFELSNTNQNSKNDANEKKWEKELRECQTLVAKLRDRKYLINFIIAFSQTLSIWSFENQKFFLNLIMKIFASNRHSNSHYIRRMTLNNRMRHLLEYLFSVFDTSKVLIHVILISYTTFVLRTKYSRNKHDEITRNKMKKTKRRTQNDEKEHENDDDEDTNDAKDSDNEKANKNRWMFVNRDCFARMILDETQKTKTIRFLIIKQILSLNVALRLLLNAILMINKTSNLYDLLRILWNEKLTSTFENLSNIALYDQTKTILIEKILTTNIIKRYQWILNSYVFKKIVKSFAKDVVIDSKITNRVLLVILVLCSLRRTFAFIIANVNDENRRIDHDISHANWMHCELEMRDNQFKQYATIYDKTISKLKKDFDDKSKFELKDMITYRRLCHVTIAFDLNQFYHEKVAFIEKKSLKNWLKKYKTNNDATMYWTWIRSTTKLDSFDNRDEFAYVTLTDAIKMCFTIHLFHHICRQQRRKCIVFCEWSFTQWLIKIILQNLNFQIIVIRTKHKSTKRTMIMKEFNRKNNEVNVLIINIKFDNLEQNMQNDCCDCIFLDIWLSTSNVSQCFDRIHRMKQIKICHFYIVNLDHFYDQVVQINAINKMLIILESMKTMKMIAIDFEKFKSFASNKKFVSNKIDILINDQIKIRLIQDKVDNLYQSQYDIRNSRTNWNNVRDLTKKNSFLVEIEFRKRFNLKKLSSNHRLSQSKDDFAETFKNRFRYDANMLFINNIFFVHSVDIFINKRQNETVQRFRIETKVATKKIKVAKLTKKLKENKNNAANALNKRNLTQSKQHKFNSKIENNDMKFITFSSFSRSNDSIANFVFDEKQSKRNEQKKSLSLMFHLKKRDSQNNNDHQSSLRFEEIASSSTTTSSFSSFANRSQSFDNFNVDISNTKDRLAKQIKKIIYSTRNSIRIVMTKNWCCL